jgi:glycine/D-amino acid oxidase-like deaminating enzyme
MNEPERQPMHTERFSNDVIAEPGRSTPVTGSYDVVVVGGGMAGVAAAVAAARNSARVCLLEKAHALGGLATLGVVTMWLPLCDGMGRQVIAGLGEELLRLSVADLKSDWPAARFRGVPACWGEKGDMTQRRQERYRAHFNPAAYLLALEKLVVDAGVTLLYDTRVCGVRSDGGHIKHLLAEGKSGRFAIGCRTVVDASGDADVCDQAGETTESLDSNVAAGWFYTLSPDGELALHQSTRPYCPAATRAGGRGPFFRGDRSDQLTGQILASRELLRERLAQLREQYPGTDLQPIMPAVIACVRMTRRLVGQLSICHSHCHVWLEDTVGLTGDWRKAGPVYPIPLRALRAVRHRNLLAAGRCISADVSVWDVTRAIPGCVVSGEAVGTVAAMASVTSDGDTHAIAVESLQAQLIRQGVLLDRALVRPLSS